MTKLSGKWKWRTPKGVRRINREWKEWRYGALPEKRPEAVLNKDARAHVISKVATMLADFRLTPFEHEARCHHALREGFCLEGHSWRASEAEANEIVREALHRIGAKRPTWEQGQPEYAGGKENCSWCHVPLASDHRSRFCDSHCAKMWTIRRGYEGLSDDNPIRVQALRMVRRSVKKPRVCEECGSKFGHEGDKDPKKFCSHACYSKNKTNRPVPSECRACGKPFIGYQVGAFYCSNACQLVISRMRSGKNMPKRISPPVFDYMFKLAA